MTPRFTERTARGCTLMKSPVPYAQIHLPYQGKQNKYCWSWMYVWWTKTQRVKYYSQFCGLSHNTFYGSRIFALESFSYPKSTWTELALRSLSSVRRLRDSLDCSTMTRLHSLRTGFICHHFSQYAHPFPPYNLANVTREACSVTMAKVSWQKQEKKSIVAIYSCFLLFGDQSVKPHINTFIDTRHNSYWHCLFFPGIVF